MKNKILKRLVQNAKRNVGKMISAIALDDLTFNAMYPYLEHYTDEEKFNIVEKVAFLSLIPIECREEFRKEYGIEYDLFMMFATLAETSIIKTGKLNVQIIKKDEKK